MQQRRLRQLSPTTKHRKPKVPPRSACQHRTVPRCIAGSGRTRNGTSTGNNTDSRPQNARRHQRRLNPPPIGPQSGCTSPAPPAQTAQRPPRRPPGSQPQHKSAAASSTACSTSGFPPTPAAPYPAPSASSAPPPAQTHAHFGVSKLSLAATPPGPAPASAQSTRSPMKIPQVELLIRRMQIVIRQPEPHNQRRRLQHLHKIPDDRNRPTSRAQTPSPCPNTVCIAAVAARTYSFSVSTTNGSPW